MEIYFFNSDFEEKLYSGKIDERQITKKTKEFEYFIHLLSPDVFLYSNKNYAEDYQNWISDFTGKRIRTTLKNENIIPWCNDYSQFELSRKLQSKTETLLLLQKENLLPHQVEIVSENSSLKTNYLYKTSNSQSGGGHMLYPKDEHLLLKKISQKIPIVGEPLLSRFLDFSTLFHRKEKLSIYQNEIDSKFQYKGSVIGLDLQSLDEFSIQYEKAIEVILEYVDGFDGYFSIDSFIFKSDKGNLLYPACEINARKTMGFVAFELKKMYFPQSRLLKLKLVRNHGEKIDYKKVQSHFGDQVYLISPTDNIFFVFIILADNQKILLETEQKLLTRFF